MGLPGQVGVEGVAHGAAALLAVGAALTDWRTGRIPNWMTLPGMLLGLFLGGLAGGASGFLDAMLGLLVCGFVPYWIFRKGGMGGGDLKLFAALGALTGLRLGIAIELASLLVGVLVAMGRMAWEGRLLRLLSNTFFLSFNAVLPSRWRRDVRPEESGAIRLGLSIAMGTLAVLADHYRVGGL